MFGDLILILEITLILSRIPSYSYSMKNRCLNYILFVKHPAANPRIYDELHRTELFHAIKLSLRVGFSPDRSVAVPSRLPWS